MNTGIQDAWNLGWKLALVASGRAQGDLLDTYAAERWPVGRNLLRTTDRLFSLFTRVMAGSRVAAWFRRTIAARLVPWLFRSPRLRARAFEFVSELGIAHRDSPAVAEGAPRLRAGPRAGERLPDARLDRNGASTHLQREVAGPRFHLLLCGDVGGWDAPEIAAIAARHADLVAVLHLTATPAPDALVDDGGAVLRRLGLRRPDDAAQYLVRPDGYIAARCAGRDLRFVSQHLARWTHGDARGRT
jgi:hypothetical protein